MLQKNHYKYFSFFLILLSISSFFVGFIYNENSAGGGSFIGDFEHTWRNLQTFLNNDISAAVNLTTSYDREIFRSSRTPLLYILHKLFNPKRLHLLEERKEVFFLYHYHYHFYFTCV